MVELVKTSYSKEDVEILLQDVRGKVDILDTEEREKLNQSGVHYSEMLPLEYVPTEEYEEIYNKALGELSYETACAVAVLGEKLNKKKGKEMIIVSLARAGTPIGILVKRYMKYQFGYDVPHYSISIIRGKGFDKAAMSYIVDKHGVGGIQFLDGWVGKGAINKVLDSACKELEDSDKKFKGLDSELAVLSDPANVTELCGTTQDFLIPSACLNATVSGLVSRTVHIEDKMTNEEFHGAVYYEEFEKEDKSIEFIETVVGYFDEVDLDYFGGVEKECDIVGLDEVKEIALKYGVEDFNKIKPGVGETTRVLLRRLPDRVLLSDKIDEKYTRHILKLCEEKGIKVEKYPFKLYGVCGIIKEISDL